MDSTASPVETPPPRRGWIALLGLLCALAATPAYILLMDVPYMRATALPTWVCLVAGLALAAHAARADRRGWVRTIAGVNAFLLLGSLVAWFALGRLPQPSAAPAVGSALPDFTLPDPDGVPVSIADEIAKGPVLLVFYRGFW